MPVPFEELSCEGLTVITPGEDCFVEAVTSKAFIRNLPGKEHFPDAVLVCTTTAAVQASVKFCKDHNLRVSPRTGGHNWFAIWLQGEGSVIVDVGGLDGVEFDAETETIVAGPGVTSVNTKLPKGYFFPSGHCPTVPLGGFILGGGYGVGFQKYGMASALVKGMEVVLASGEVRHVKDSDDDPESKALMDMVRGSFHRFPGVITKYELRACKAAQCVIPQHFLFDLKDWKLAVQYGRDIMHRGEDKDFSDIETTVVFCHCPPDLAKATGTSKIVMLALMMWSDEDEVTTRATLERYTKHISGTILPSEPGTALDAHAVDQTYGPMYPEARYLTQAFHGDESGFDMSDEAMCELLQPLATAWMSDDGVPGPPSHTLLVLMNKNLREVNGCDLAMGFVPSFELLFYAIFQEEELEESIRAKLRKAMRGVSKSRASWTALPEGNIRSGKESFSKGGQEALAKNLEQLDPVGVFMKN